MGLVLDNTLIEIIISLLVVFYSFYLHFTKDYEFWAKRGVPHKRAVFPWGSLKSASLAREHSGQAYGAVYKEFPGERFCGVVDLRVPVLVVRDPDLVKQILVKDFTYFVDRAPGDRTPSDHFSKHLFNIDESEKWRELRHKLTPAFTSGKLKQMLQLMLKCSEQLGDCMHDIARTQGEVDVKRILTAFTIDVIGSCAFGVETNSLKDETSQFFRLASTIFKPPMLIVIGVRIITLFPALAAMLKLKRIHEKYAVMVHDLVNSTVKAREETHEKRNDLIDILIKLKNNEIVLDEPNGEINTDNPTKLQGEAVGLTEQEMTAQAFVFFAAGFETSSSTMTFCLYELAKHQDIQQRLWREVDEVLQRHEGQITYEGLKEMTYMDQVINETLRLYPSLPILHRRCTRPYKIPDTDLILQKGQKIIIPVYGIQHDPQYYPDPHIFDPERFSSENSKNRHPCVHLPFGDGPRNCIGMRFGMMQTKIGLATLLSQFRFDIAPNTPLSITILSTSFVAQPEHPLYLKVVTR